MNIIYLICISNQLFRNEREREGESILVHFDLYTEVKRVNTDDRQREKSDRKRRRRRLTGILCPDFSFDWKIIDELEEKKE